MIQLCRISKATGGNLFDEFSELGDSVRTFIGRCVKNLDGNDFTDTLFEKYDDLLYKVNRGVTGADIELKSFQDRLKMVADLMENLNPEEFKSFGEIFEICAKKNMFQSDVLELPMHVLRIGDCKYFKDMLKIRQELLSITDTSNLRVVEKLDNVFADSLRTWPTARGHASMGHIYAVRAIWKKLDPVEIVMEESSNLLGGGVRRYDCAMKLKNGRIIKIEVKSYIVSQINFRHLSKQILKDVKENFSSNFENLVWTVSRHSDGRKKDLIDEFRRQINSTEFSDYLTANHSGVTSSKVLNDFDSRVLNHQDPPIFMIFDFALVD